MFIFSENKVILMIGKIWEFLSFNKLFFFCNFTMFFQVLKKGFWKGQKCMRKMSMKKISSEKERKCQRSENKEKN